jgi:S1-C subfamily serine protease
VSDPLPTRSALPTHAVDQVEVGGFTEYERAALRVRNVGCGTVSMGSGFAISDHVFVTNRHVIAGAAVIQVSTFDGHDIDVTTAGAAVIADLALVWTKESLPRTIGLATQNPDVGENVTAVGFPLAGPLTTTHGKVLGYAPDLLGLSQIPMLVNDAPVEHGSSGSPLINDGGRLVGVVYAGDGDQYAVPVETLIQVLNNPAEYAGSAACDGATG